MKFQLLPSSIEAGREVSQRQHLSCVVINDRVALDAGSLAFSCSELQRGNIRDIIISHSHLDHIAGLPIFIDDLFAVLTEAVRIHASPRVIEILERDIFNWSVYPKFSELNNDNGPVVEYRPFDVGGMFTVGDLSIYTIAVNHKIESVGFLVVDANVSIGFTGDTSSTDQIWSVFNARNDLAAVMVECAFPNGLADLAASSHHMTPALLGAELSKFGRPDVPVYVINMKPMYRETVISELMELKIPNLSVLEVGRDYEF